jgi:hypothetical protein
MIGTRPRWLVASSGSFQRAMAGFRLGLAQRKVPMGGICATTVDTSGDHGRPSVPVHLLYKHLAPSSQLLVTALLR